MFYYKLRKNSNNNQLLLNAIKFVFILKIEERKFDDVYSRIFVSNGFMWMVITKVKYCSFSYRALCAWQGNQFGCAYPPLTSLFRRHEVLFTSFYFVPSLEIDLVTSGIFIGTLYHHYRSRSCLFHNTTAPFSPLFIVCKSVLIVYFCLYCNTWTENRFL